MVVSPSITTRPRTVLLLPSRSRPIQKILQVRAMCYPEHRHAVNEELPPARISKQNGSMAAIPLSSRQDPSS